MSNRSQLKNLSKNDKARLIEQYVNNPTITMKVLGALFDRDETTVSDIISRDWFGRVKNPVIIKLPSKLNQPEYSLLTIE